MMVKWEYLVLPIGLFPNAPGKAQDFLDDYGAKGWELISVHRNTTVFKRPQPGKEG